MYHSFSPMISRCLPFFFCKGERKNRRTKTPLHSTYRYHLSAPHPFSDTSYHGTEGESHPEINDLPSFLSFMISPDYTTFDAKIVD